MGDKMDGQKDMDDKDVIKEQFRVYSEETSLHAMKRAGDASASTFRRYVYYKLYDLCKILLGAHQVIVMVLVRSGPVL